MNKREFDNFELLLIAAAEDCVNDMTEEFLSTDTTGITISPKTDRKIRRYIKKHKKPTARYKPLKVALVACLTVMSLAFTACMAVPQIRQAIYSVVVEWYDNFMGINFCGDPANTEPPTDDIPTTPPSTIEKKAYAAYLPGSYTSEVITDTNMCYQTNYFNESENLIFTLQQRIIHEELKWNDDEGTQMQEVSINGYKAFLISYDNEPNIYTLIWQDHSYMYSLYGYFESEEELMKVGENIRLRPQTISQQS